MLKVSYKNFNQDYKSNKKRDYSGFQGFILLFDLTNLNTFESIEEYLCDIMEFNQNPVMLIGNKKDENNRKVGKEKIENLIYKYQQKGLLMNYIETSSTYFTDNALIINDLLDMIYKNI
jgi:GTPase SAR1 family protein